MDLLFLSIEFEHTRKSKGDRAPSGTNIRNRPSWARQIGLAALIVFVAVGAGWVLAGGGFSPFGLEDWDRLGSDSAATAGNTGKFKLSITSSPTGANVNVDGRDRGHTPLSLGVTPGEHTLVVKHAEMLDDRRQLAVSGDQNVDVALWRSRPQASQLRPPYPGSRIQNAMFLNDGRLAWSVLMPNANSREREGWLFDPVSGSVSRFAGDQDASRARAVSISPDGRQLAYLRRGGAADEGAAADSEAARLDEVWVGNTDGPTDATRIFALPRLAGSGAKLNETEDLRDAVWLPDGNHLLLVARRLNPSGNTGFPARSRLLLLDVQPLGNKGLALPTELLILPADVVPGSYLWAPDGHWVAFLANTTVGGSGTDDLALCALDMSARGGFAGFRYVADMGRQTESAFASGWAQAAWQPPNSGGSRLLYVAPKPRVSAGNILSLPGASSGEAGLFTTMPAGPMLAPDDGRPIGGANGLVGLTWRTTPGPAGATVLGLAQADSEEKPLVVKGVDLSNGATTALGIQMPDVRGTPIAARWDERHGRVLILVRHPGSSDPTMIDFWLAQLTAGAPSGLSDPAPIAATGGK